MVHFSVFEASYTPYQFCRPNHVHLKINRVIDDPYHVLPSSTSLKFLKLNRPQAKSGGHSYFGGLEFREWIL